MKKPVGILHFLQFLHLMQEQEEVEAPQAKPEPRNEDAPYFDLEDPTHAITYLTPMTDTISWLRYRGYRVVTTGVPGAVISGVVFSRKNGAATVAVVGDVLEYDGKNVVVMD